METTARSPRIDQPEPGLYRTRLVKNGPWVPVRIWWSVARDPVTGEKLDRSPRLLCLVAGREADPEKVWLGCHRIDRREYERLVANISEDDPRKAVDIDKLPPPF